MIDETSWDSVPAEPVAAAAAGDATPGLDEAVPLEPAAAATENVGEAAVAAEPVTPPAEGEAPPVVGPATDIFAQYRDDAGLILGKYRTPQDLAEAAANADRAIAAKAHDLQVAQQRLQQLEGGGRPAAPPTLDPLRDLAPMLRTPPAKLLEQEAFIRYGEQRGVEWETDDDGFVTPGSALNAANLNWVRDLMRDDVGAAQVQIREAETAATQAEEQFYTAFPKFKGWEADVVTAAQELEAAGLFAGKSYAETSAILAQRVDAVITAKAASLLGKSGGQAAAAARVAVSPVGGTARAGTGGTVKDETEW